MVGGNIKMREQYRIAEICNPKFEAPMIGFTPEQARRVKNHIESIDLPPDNIEEVVYRPNKRGEKGIVGSFEPFNGRLTVYKDLDKLPPIAQHGTIVHEMTHSVSPLDPCNEPFYGSNEEISFARNHAIAVAYQSLVTQKYINGYQAFLAKKLAVGEIDKERFVEETNAIMVEQRFTNLSHLEQVEKSQKNKLKELKRKGSLEAANLRPVDVVAGVEQEISSLIPKLKTKGAINRHVNNLKQGLIAQGRPILPNKRLALAA